MKKSVVFCLVLVALTMLGCIRPPNYPGLVQIQTNEIAFLVDMTGDGVTVGSNSIVQKKDIPIAGYFVRTGRFEHQGYWRPLQKVIVVSQAPVRREWDAKDNTNTVRAVSRESSGFVIPMILNAFIATESDAVKYLKAFKPVNDETIDWSKIEQKDWRTYAREAAQPLSTALDTVVYTRIMQQLSSMFVKTPILNAEVASKIYIKAVYEGMTAKDLNAALKTALPGVDITFSEDVLSLQDWALNTYGITITAMAPGDGVIYDSKEVQAQIDNLATAVMKEKTLIQEQANAIAQARVREENARAERSVAAIQAETANSRAALQKIENDKAIAEATAEAIRNGKVVPAGSYPVGLTNLIITPNYNSLNNNR